MNGAPRTIGGRIRLKDAFLDEALTRPVIGTVEDVYRRPDWGNQVAYVVMFDHDEPRMPPGGEFTANLLVPLVMDASTLAKEPTLDEALRDPALRAVYVDPYASEILDEPEAADNEEAA
jgi:hypothetical protein